jgi:hypothetical protein
MTEHVWRSGERAIRSPKPDIPHVEESQLTESIISNTTQSNRREKMNGKINERYMIQQVGQNPFLTGNYMEDLQVQEQFLRPKSSHVENKDVK